MALRIAETPAVTAIRPLGQEVSHMFGIARTGEQMARMATMDCPGPSSPVDGELLDDGICQQFGREFGDPARINGIRELDFKTLALADREHLGEPEPVARAGDGLALRIVDLRLEHDVHDYLGHSTQRTRTQHLTCREERRVLSQRNTMTDDRQLIKPAGGISVPRRQGVARGRQSCRASCLPILAIPNS